MTNDRLSRAPISKDTRAKYTRTRASSRARALTYVHAHPRAMDEHRRGSGAVREESRASVTPSGQRSRGHREDRAARNHYVTRDPYEPVDALP